MVFLWTFRKPFILGEQHETTLDPWGTLTISSQQTSAAGGDGPGWSSLWISSPELRLSKWRKLLMCSAARVKSCWIRFLWSTNPKYEIIKCLMWDQQCFKKRNRHTTSTCSYNVVLIWLITYILSPRRSKKVLLLLVVLCCFVYR